MATTRRLDVTLHLDRSEYAKSEKAARAESKATAAAMISDADAAAKAQVEFVKRANSQKIAELAKAKKTEVELAKEAEASKAQTAKEAAASLAAMNARVGSDLAQKKARWAAEDRAAHAKAIAALKAEERATVGLGDAVTGLASGAAVLGTIYKAAGLFAESMNAASDFTKRVAADFITAQKSMQSMAALTGAMNTDKFTSEQIKEAMAANLKPDEMTAFKDAFLSKASNYVGAGPNARLNEEESTKFQRSMAEYAKLHGVPMAEMADFAGGLLGQQKGPTTAAALTSRAGKTFATLEASSAKVGHLLPGMTRVMAQGFAPEEAAPFLAQMPEIAPEEESTHLLRIVAEVRQLMLDKKGDQFGVGAKMSPAKQLEALVGNLSTRAKGGEDLDTMIQSVTKEQIAGNTLRGLVRQGQAGIDQWKGILARTADDVVPKDIAAGRQSSAGRTMRAESQLAGQEALRGARYADVTRLKMEAEAALTRDAFFDVARPVEDSIRKAAEWFGAPSARQQYINERAVEMANTGLPWSQQERLSTSGGTPQLTADNVLRSLIEKQNAILEKQLALAERQAAARPAAKGPPAPIPGKAPPIPGRLP